MVTETREDINLEGEGAFMPLLGLRFGEMSPSKVVASFETGVDHHQPWRLVYGGVFTAVIETGPPPAPTSRPRIRASLRLTSTT
jgi:acyl-coenzyme A thioesterase PaaI-like protein